jgi:glycosyltransferase involved in cell wall biosynthesis
MVAPDLPPSSILPSFTISDKPKKIAGQVKLIFYSRITHKKNLNFLLDRLADIREGEIELTIAGPVEDSRYWLESQKRIRLFPQNIRVNVVGTVTYDEGLELLREHHFFSLPSIHENFGYVVLEALSAGCPVLISDRTMWSDILGESSSWSVPLDRLGRWEEILDEMVAMEDSDYKARVAASRDYAVKWLSQPEVEGLTLNVLESVLSN